MAETEQQQSMTPFESFKKMFSPSELLRNLKTLVKGKNDENSVVINPAASEDNALVFDAEDQLFGTLELGSLNQDCRAGESNSHLISPFFMREGKFESMDTSHSVSFGIKTETSIKKGEPLMIFPPDRIPLYLPEGKVRVLPVSWHQKILLEYQATKVLPKGLVLVDVPEELVVQNK